MGWLERTSWAMDYLTGEWWFYLLLLALGFLPPCASRGYSWPEIPDVIGEGLSHAVIYELVRLAWPAALLHVLALAVITAVVLLGREGSSGLRPLGLRHLPGHRGRAEHRHIGALRAGGPHGQHGSGPPGGLLLGLGVPSWPQQVQARAPGQEAPLARPLAAWAYWSPVEPFQLDPRYLLLGYFGVAYCLTTPVVLTLMALYHPDVNRPVMRLTAFLGLAFGVLNVTRPLTAGPTPAALWEGTILHLPLLITSAYALALTIRAPRRREG